MKTQITALCRVVPQQMIPESGGFVQEKSHLTRPRFEPGLYVNTRTGAR